MNSMQCSNIDDLLFDVKYLKKKILSYKDRQSQIAKMLTEMQNDVNAYSGRRQLIESAKQYYLKAIDVVYMSSIEEMENFVNHVLGYVFYDEQYKIKLDISNRYNKSITFYLVDGNKGLETPLRKGNGKGIKAVVSFILLTYYLLRMKSNYLFLDETFVNISAGYIQRFFNYVKYLCNKHGLCVVLITHDTRLPEYADVVYKVVKGNIERII